MRLLESQIRKIIQNIIHEKIRDFKNVDGSRKSQKQISSFNINELKQLVANQTTLESKVKECHKYCSQRLQSLGVGSSRETFVLTNKYAIKVARPNGLWKAGIGQNEHEVLVNKTSPKIQLIIPKIRDYDDKFIWVITEIVKPVSNKYLINFLDMKLGILHDILRDITHKAPPGYITRPNTIPNDTRSIIEYYINREYYDYGLHKGELKKTRDDVVQFIDALAEFIDINELEIGDVIYQIAITPERRLVIFDYGLNDDIVQQYYV